MTPALYYCRTPYSNITDNNVVNWPHAANDHVKVLQQYRASVIAMYFRGLSEFLLQTRGNLVCRLFAIPMSPFYSFEECLI